MAATEIAAAVRAGSRRAADVLEEHLGAIAEREAEIHAFNVVLADEARAAAAAIDDAVAAGRDPGPLAGVPRRPQGQHVHAGDPHDVLVAHPRGLAPALRRHGRRAPAGGRRGARRQDQPRRVRHGLEHRELGVRPDPQPARHRPGARRVERRQRGGRRRRLRRRSPSAPTPAARSASRPRCAASSASSRRTASSAATASSPSPAASTRSARSPARWPTPPSSSR